MNKVEFEVEEIIIPIHRKETGYWSVTVFCVCWGHRSSRTIECLDKESVDRFCVGYKWME